MATGDLGNWLWPCEYVEEITGRPKGEVPHFLPGKNPFLKQFPQRLGIPEEAARGIAEIMYPGVSEENLDHAHFRGNEVKRWPLLPLLSATSAYSQDTPADPADIELLPVQGNIYKLATDGANVTIQVGHSSTLTPLLTDKVLAAICKLSDQPIRYVINTSVDGDHTGGNEGIARTGALPSDIPLINTPGATAKGSVQILAHRNVLNR